MASRSKRFSGSVRTAFAAALLAGFLAACAVGPGPVGPGEADVVGRFCTAETPYVIPPQPDNVGDLPQGASTEVRAKAIAEARKYYSSRAYMAGIASVDAAAKDYVVRHAQGQAANGRLVLVLDIDETSLSNWQEIDANNFQYFANGPCPMNEKGEITGHSCGMLAWDMMEKATAIKPTLDLFNAAKMQGVPVFFITGRGEDERGWTEENLRKAGYAGWLGLIMRPPEAKDEPAATYKRRERAYLMAQGFTILASVGDQPSDLQGGCAESAFLLPDPFYRIP